MADALRPSIVILTLNEETRLPACLASVQDADDVVVVDSGSTDRTLEIARSAGARVFTNRFVNFAEQRNFAHTAVDFRHPWVFHLDADEHMLPELLAECGRIMSANPPVDGYFVAPQMLFRGRWLRRCTDHPAWQARFVRSRGFSFIQCGHGQREAPHMKMGYLESGYTHDITFASEAEWEAKHRRYAREEAVQVLSDTVPARRIFGQLLSGHGLARRRALKQLSHLMPGRPLLRLVYQYIFKGGFLDGPEAYSYCRRLARYEAFIDAEIKRLKNDSRG